MDQTRGIDRSQSLEEQMIQFLAGRFEVPGVVLGGDMQYYKKAAMGLKSLASDYYARHPNESKVYVED